MKKSFLIVILIITNVVNAQIKIGDNPQVLNTASLLELESSSKVLVISRMSELEMADLNPLQGAMVYNLDASCIYYYDGLQWNNLCNNSGTGNMAWGSLTGSLTDQVDLVTELENYVDINTNQNVGGEKIFTNKLTVDTGDLNAQIAEFLGRVKGEDGVDAEDFVTKAQLDASGGGDSSWGSISGSLEDQADLVTEFQNYVNLTANQSVAGEKTLTDKLTVDTGDLNDQIAEFLGRVKGEEGTDPEDFVTKSQLDVVVSGGQTGVEGSIFFAGANTLPTESNDNLFYDEGNKQLKVGAFRDRIDIDGFSDDLTTFRVEGSISKPFGTPRILTEEHHTTLVLNSTFITLPDPRTCLGRIYIIKTSPKNALNPSEDTRVQITNGDFYNDTQSIRRTEFPAGSVTQLQSSGFTWEQIN